jgi:hypothetical protein
MHINHSRGETRSSVRQGRSRRSWAFYKKTWNRRARRWAKVHIDEDSQIRWSGRCKTWIYYW